MNAPESVAAKDARITPHSLRRTLASRLVKEGISIYMGQQDTRAFKCQNNGAAYGNLAPLDASAVVVRAELGYGIGAKTQMDVHGLSLLPFKVQYGNHYDR